MKQMRLLPNSMLKKFNLCSRAFEGAGPVGGHGVIPITQGYRDSYPNNISKSCFIVAAPVTGWILRQPRRHRRGYMKQLRPWAA
jgi:hypothetical protein